MLIEPFIGDGTTLPLDYKLCVFHGRVAAIQAHADRETDHRLTLYDRAWRRQSATPASFDREPPLALADMTSGAETLGSDFDFVRVDLYDVNGTPRFGGMNFYPGLGLDRFDQPDLKERLGRLWFCVGAIARHYGAHRSNEQTAESWAPRSGRG